MTRLVSLFRRESLNWITRFGVVNSNAAMLLTLAARMRVQAHFSAPSSERRKLMSAPLSTELRKKYNVRQFTSI